MKRKILLVLTLMLSGRAMTIAFLGRVGGQGPGDPPAPWILPLWGDAIIGVSAILIAAIIRKRHDLLGWTAIVVWNALAIWDALSAFLLHLAVPWPEFFMIRLFGSSMFFAAVAMHAVCLYLVCSADVRKDFLPDAA